MSRYFEADYIETNYFEGDPIEASATLQSQFTITCEPVNPYIEADYIDQDYFVGDAPPGVTHEGAASMSAQFTQTSAGSKTLTGASTQSAQFSQSTSGLRIRLLNQGITASFSVSSQGARTRSTAITMTSQFGVSEAQPTRIKQLSATIGSALSATMTVSALKNHTAVLDSTISFTATAVKTVSNTEALSNIIALSLQGDRTRATSSTLSSQFSQTTQAQSFLTIISSQTATTNQTVSGDRIRFGTSTQTSTFTISATAALVFDVDGFTTASISGSTGLDAVASLSNTITRFAGASATLAGAFTPSITCIAQRTVETVMNSTVTLSCSAEKIKLMASAMSSAFTISATGSIPFYKFQLSDIGSPNVTFNGEMQVTGVSSTAKQIVNAYNFGVNPDEATATTNVLGDFADQDWTFEFFVDPGSSFPTNGKIFGLNGNEAILMQRNSSNWEIKVRRSNNTYQSLTASYDQFNAHYAIQRIGNKIELYQSGFFVADSGNITANATLQAGVINIATIDDFDIDEIRFTLGTRYSNANTGSTLDYTVPTAPLSNDAGTIYTFHMDDAVADSGLEDASATLNSAFSFNLEFIKDFASTQTAISSLSCNGGVLLETDADLSSAITQSTTAIKTTDTSADFDAINIVLTAASKIGDFLIAYDVIFSKSFTVQKITDITKTLSSAFTQSTDVVKTVVVDSDLDSTITQSTAIDRIRSGSSTQAVTASLSCFAVETDDFTMDFTVTAALECETSTTRSTGSELSSTHTASITAIKKIDIAKTINTEFTQTTVGQAGLFANADLDSAFSLSLTPSITRTFDVNFDAINTQITVAVRTAAFFINHDLTMSMTTVNSRQRNTSATLDSASSISTTILHIKPLSASITGASTLTANGVTQRDSESSITANFSQTVTAVKTVSVSATLASENAFTLTALVARGGDIDLISTTSVLASADRRRNTSATKSVVVSISTNAGKLADVAASFTTTVTVITEITVIHTTDIVYVIPAETREFSIKTETRDITIDAEDREHKVLRLI